MKLELVEKQEIDGTWWYHVNRDGIAIASTFTHDKEQAEGMFEKCVANARAGYPKEQAIKSEEI